MHGKQPEKPGALMPEEASKDWLDVAKTRAQGIRAALAAIGVFVACVLVTVFGQVRQYAVDSKAEAIAICFLGDSTPGSDQVSDNRDLSCPAAPDRGILQAAYAEFPRQQIDTDLTPWNQFAIESTIIGSFVEGTDPKKFAGSTDPAAKLVWMLAEASLKTPLKPGTTSEISHFYLWLGLPSKSTQQRKRPSRLRSMKLIEIPSLVFAARVCLPVPSRLSRPPLNLRRMKSPRQLIT
jgi:hypothetical protein